MLHLILFFYTLLQVRIRLERQLDIHLALHKVVIRFMPVANSRHKKTAALGALPSFNIRVLLSGLQRFQPFDICRRAHSPARSVS